MGVPYDQENYAAAESNSQFFNKTILYDTIEEFNVDSITQKLSQLNLAHVAIIQSKKLKRKSTPVPI